MPPLPPPKGGYRNGKGAREMTESAKVRQWMSPFALSVRKH